MEQRATAVITAAFGATVAMWGVGYLGRLPSLMLPSQVILVLLLAALAGVGLWFGRTRGVRWVDAALAGGLTGILNLLILGSLLSGTAPGSVVPSALIWVAGSILVSSALMVAGQQVGASVGRIAPPRSWTALFGLIAVASTMFLLALGGLVTSAEAGLAVVDWPNSFGYNMFLYPLSRMTGGIYYEHAHRLFGALVGLTTVTFAVLLQIHATRRWVRRLGWAAVVMVCVQGLLGGLRVTGGLTLSTDAVDMAPSTALAMVHGVFGQIFFATLVALVVFATPDRPSTRAMDVSPSSLRTDGILGLTALGAMLLQLSFGAAQRHLQSWLMAHLGWGLLIVTPLLLMLGVRAWARTGERRWVRRSGLALSVGVILQITLGFVAYVATGAGGAAGVRSLDLLFATAHQWFGAALLGLATSLVCWNARRAWTVEKPLPEVAVPDRLTAPMA